MTPPESPADLPGAAIDRIGGPAAATGFRGSLAAWFRREARDYPWRRTRDPYAILVSELMLQQTQIATVLGRGYYERWMRAFPDWASLAAAPEESVIKHWEGLGYYNRARHLHRTARLISEDHGGRFPQDPETALGLPGVGRYTVGAVLSFAYGLPLPLVDGNVGRVLARLLALGAAINSPAGLKVLWEWAADLLDHGDPGTHNSALMELGQRICRPTQPDCPACPVRAHCLAHRHDLTASLPVKAKAATVTRRVERVVLADRGGRIYLCPESGSRRRGLWRLPEIDGEAAADLAEILRFDYTITRYRVTLLVHAASVAWRPGAGPDREGAWFSLQDQEAWPPLGSPYRRALGLYTDLRDSLDLKG